MFAPVTTMSKRNWPVQSHQTLQREVHVFMEYSKRKKSSIYYLTFWSKHSDFRENIVENTRITAS